MIIVRKILLSNFLFTVITTFGQEIKPEATEDWSNKPAVVTPGKAGGAPSDAVVLFSGKQDIDQWECIDGGPVKWDVKDDVLQIVKKAKDIQTKQKFGSVQLHLEWRT